jgi:restriction system protein
MENSTVSNFSLTPGIPTYSSARAFIKTIQGIKHSLVNQMRDSIWSQVGTPKETIDWTKPEEWIPERLDGQERELAFKIWRESKGSVNPRHTRGAWYLAIKHNLIQFDSLDLIELTSQGSSFIKESDNDLIAKIDSSEGLLSILQAVSEHSPGKRSDILPSFIDFCNTYTNYRSDSVYKSALYNRIVNLIDRNLIKKTGSIFYEITSEGIDYLQKYSAFIPGRVIDKRQPELSSIAQSLTKEARKQLSEYLSHMDPYKFENLVGLLLEEMGYSNVQVTSPSNDKGVDVVADIELGISSVREVVQVKRHAGSINRTIVDLLRGSLHRFLALRGTIITTGSFAAGAKRAALEQNAAPITLIDGEKLLDLLLFHQIGISRKSVDYYEFDDTKLLKFDDEWEENQTR